MRDTDTYFTTASLRLDGRVTEGDVWRLGVRHRDYTYTVGAGEDLEDVANGLADELPDRFTHLVTKAGDVVTLTIGDEQGFTLTGLEVDGVAQRAFAAGTVTRTAEAREASGARRVPALVELHAARTSRSPARSTRATSGACASTRRRARRPRSPATRSTRSPGACGPRIGAIASGTGATITIAAAGGFTVGASVSGDAPDATPVIDGTPVAGQAGATPFTQVRYTLPATLRTGEEYVVRVRELDGTGELSGVGDRRRGRHADDLRAKLAAAVNGADDDDAYSATSAAGVVTINRATAFTSTIAVTPAGDSAPGAAGLLEDADAQRAPSRPATSGACALAETGGGGASSASRSRAARPPAPSRRRSSARSTRSPASAPSARARA